MSHEAALLVSGVAFKLWVRGVASVFRISERRVVACVIAGVGVALMFGLLLALITTRDLQWTLPEELRQVILRTSFGSAVITTGIVSTILYLMSPPHGSLQTLLELLPVSRLAAQLGQMVPVLLTGLVLCLDLCRNHDPHLGRRTTTVDDRGGGYS